MVGCADSSTIHMAPDNTQDYQDSFLLSEKEGVERALDAYGKFFEESRSRKANGFNVRLYADAKSRGESDVNPLYIVNFDGGGFSVVSAVREGEAIPYAVSKTGVFDETNNEIVKAFLDDVSSTPTFSSGALKRDTLSKEDYLCPPGWRPLGLNSDTLVREIYINKKLELGMITKWHQQSPYNMFIERGYQAGCIAIGIGQICAFNQFPANVGGYDMNWPMINSKSCVSKLDDVYKVQVGHLIKELGSMVGMVYRPSVSYASFDDVGHVFHELGYKDAKYSRSLDDCITNLLDSVPVLMGAFTINNDIGHAWVVDGAHDVFSEEHYHDRKTLKEICLTWSTHYKYLCFNWGYGGVGDGYYMAYSKTFNRESGWREKEYAFCFPYTDMDGNKIFFSENKQYYINLYPTIKNSCYNE